MNVLSLFDGMSCGRIALDKLGINVDNYFSAEIDEDAIKIANKNYPQDAPNRLGDVTKIDVSKLPQIDLFIGGSPCTSFSNAGNGTGFEGESGLFWDFIRLLKESKPKYFMLENVKMKKEWLNIITDIIGIEPILIKSNLVSAQNRERYYWTNIPNITQPQDKGIFIEDILEDEETVDSKYWLKAKNTFLLYRKVDITGAPKICAIDVYNKKFKKDNKVPTLTLPHHNSLRLLQNGRFRKFTPQECEILQTVPLNYTEGVSDSERYKMLGNGWTVDVIKHIFSFMETE